ncbi:MULTISPECIES: hypothetical protein [Paenibacillus]|uniref:hypothetical protein n=1 Tax=Paenibacillus TaxID=44249 RepID=UPI00201E1ED3|nr:hypothetical protein [Paenibacillus amylolyticus]MCL6658408.1 hypothetical protein [Paenibacillus amylolyticus]
MDVQCQPAYDASSMLNGLSLAIILPMFLQNGQGRSTDNRAHIADNSTFVPVM